MTARCGLVAMFVAANALLAGCSGKGGERHRVGGDLPVTASSSVALPGATDAADAKGSPQVMESHDASLTKYKDPANGVSFAYPEIWRPSRGAVLATPEFAAQIGAPRITEEFLPKGTYYEPTVLRALIFSYGVKHGSNAAACAGVPGKSTADGGEAATVHLNGVPFTEVHGGDAGMCTHVQSTIDSTFVQGRCLVFERDVVTGCPYVKSKTLPRPLTDAESVALHRHLDAVMSSVRVVQEK